MYPCLKFELHVAINASWIFTMDSCESVFCLFLIYPTTCALNYGMIQISVFGCVENIEIAHNGCLKLNKRDVYTETKLCPTFSGNIWSSCYFIVPKKLAAILKILGPDLHLRATVMFVQIQHNVCAKAIRWIS